MDDDDVPRLNPSALAALQEFYTERDTREKQFSDLQSAAEEGFADNQDASEVTMDLFGEDWNASQFWYTEATASILARQLLDGATKDTRIAIVSAPSVYVALRPLLAEMPVEKRPDVKLFEFDERFGVFKKDFVFYDFKEPTRLDSALKGSFDRIICDPPFLSDECQTKTALTARWLARKWEETKAVVCTGERMEGLILRLYGKTGIRTTNFLPEHKKGLSNEFWCYASFECEDWTFKVAK